LLKNVKCLKRERNLKKKEGKFRKKKLDKKNFKKEVKLKERHEKKDKDDK
jgi:hypothetical protein